MTSTSLPSESESSLLRLDVVEPEIGGGDDGSRPAANTAGAGDVDDLGDKFLEISLTSDIS